jgi:hypothetical protein
VIDYDEVLPMKTFAKFSLVAAVVLALSAVWAMGQEPRRGGGLQPPADLRPGDRLQPPIDGNRIRPSVANQIVDLEGVDEPVTVDMSDTVRVTGRGIAGAQITIDVKGAGQLTATNNVRKVKDGLGSQVKEFLIQPTKPGKMTVKVTVRSPTGGINRNQVQEYDITVARQNRRGLGLGSAPPPSDQGK